MSDYLPTVEEAYSRCRGKYSMLSPLDWQLAQDWENAGIPIFIVLRAIDDCCRKYKSKNDSTKINTLRYFDQAVRQQFAAWNESRTGSNDTPPSMAGNMPHSDTPLDEPPCSDCGSLFCLQDHREERPCGTCTGSMFIVTARDPITWISTAIIPCPECCPSKKM